MKVLILSRRPSLYSPRRLLEEFEKAGHTSVLLDPDLGDECRQFEPQVIVPRFGAWKFEESLSLLQSFEKRRVPCVNRPNALRDARHKWIAYLTLREAELPVLPTSCLTKAELPTQYPYVVKIPDLCKGEGVFLIRKHEDRLALLGPAEVPEWVMQPYMAYAEGRDRRFFVTREEGIIAAIEREAAAGDFRSNLSLGGRGRVHEPSALEKRLVMDALDVFGLHVAGVDLMLTPQGPIINEVNGCPGLEGLEKITGVNAAAAYVRQAEALLR
ncbi:MAG: hypothetical protein KF865_08230 [Bdellovibrionaceae bacterium]|nr:hypothetical protein [Pseudobdellovibrionaceae bacterium]